MRIVIVDDSPVNLMIIGKLLDAAGYKNHISFPSVPKLLVYLNDDENGVASKADLILLDMMMPEIDGIEACKRLKASERTKDIPVIIVTALDDMLKMAEALDAGAIDFVMKPINKIELLARIRSALRLKQELDWHKQQERQIQLELELARQVQLSVLSDPVEKKGFRIQAAYSPARVLAATFMPGIRWDKIVTA